MSLLISTALFDMCVSLLGHTALHHAAVGGYEDVVQVLIAAGANVEEQNENGHTPLMESASAGHVGVAKILLDAGAGINTHSNEFKESALTLACYKGVKCRIIIFVRYLSVFKLYPKLRDRLKCLWGQKPRSQIECIYYHNMKILAIVHNSNT